MKTAINRNTAAENTNGSLTRLAPPRFAHIHAEAVNQRIREALGTNNNNPKNDDNHPSAGLVMSPAGYFAGPHNVFVCAVPRTLK